MCYGHIYKHTHKHAHIPGTGRAPLALSEMRTSVSCTVPAVYGQAGVLAVTQLTYAWAAAEMRLDVAVSTAALQAPVCSVSRMPKGKISSEFYVLFNWKRFDEGATDMST